MTPGHTGSNSIEPSNSDSVLYGYNNETSEFGFRVISVISSGVVVSSTTEGLIAGYGTDIRFDNGLVYASNGVVVNPDTLTLVGTYDAVGLVAPDSSTGRVYFLDSGFFGDEANLKIFDQNTFTLIDTFPIPGVLGFPSSLIKVGQDILAFRTSEKQLFFIELEPLAISKKGPDTVFLHQPITYTLTVTNSGPFPATNLVITDVIPVGAHYVSGGTKIGNVVRWTVPSLAANSGVTKTTFVVTATGTIINSNYGAQDQEGHTVKGDITVTTVVRRRLYLPIIKYSSQ
jgi:uncharacterized repeat protein (TIGR01451 family)